MDKGSLLEMVAEKMSTRAIGKRLGMSQTAVRYWLAKHGVAAVGRPGHQQGGASSKVCELTDAELAKIVAESRTYEELLAAFGYRNVGPRSAVRKRILAAGIKTEHIDERPVWNELSIDEILFDGSPHSRQSIKRHLLSHGLLKEKCAICDIGPEWNGKKLVLQLDHKNGRKLDYRLENLRLLCPNCHSQTESFSGRNLKLARETVV